MQSQLERIDFDRYLNDSEKLVRQAALASNDAFVAAMNGAITRRREKAVPGTFVDLTPAIGAFRIRGDVLMSLSGSPAQMCIEASVPQIGSVALMK